MLQKIIILGNQFICDKRLCNIVQKTVTIDESEMESYFHLHKFFKDQRAIVVDPAVNVSTGYIFTGEAFVNPITMQSYSIDGEVDEEEIDTSAASEIDEHAIERAVARIVNPIVRKLDRYLQNEGPLYNEFEKVKKYQVICGSIHVRKGPSSDYTHAEFKRTGDVVDVYGIDPNTNFGYIGNGNWISLNEKYMREVK